MTLPREPTGWRMAFLAVFTTPGLLLLGLAALVVAAAVLG